MSPLYSWLALLVAVGGLTWYYNGRPNLITKIISSTPPSNDEKTSEKARNKRSKVKRGYTGEQGRSEAATPAPISAPSSPSNKKRKIAAPPPENVARASPKEASQAGAQEGDASLSNKEFAKQFSQARQGTQLVPPSTKPGFSKKERRANKNAASRVADSFDSPNLSTEASSTTGGDADDDLSPAGSPPLGATSSTKLTHAGDISDMLEKPKAGPAVLRLIDPKGTLNKAPAKTVAKPFEVAETKKQRQARQKRAAQKMANEEAERERRRLMEKQIRGARLAEGTSTQTKASSFKPPTTNAWVSNSRPQNSSLATQPVPQFIEELDTRDPESAQTSVPAVSITNPTVHPEHKDTQEESINFMKKALGIDTSGATHSLHEGVGVNGMRKAEPGSSTQSNTSWADDLPSEEEQMRLFQQQDTWTTVANKKEKKKGVANSVGGKEVDTLSEGSIDAPRHNGTIRPAAVDGTLKRNEASNRFIFGEQQDSEWAA